MFEGVLKVVVVDDSALYRQMLLTVLGRIAGVEVVGTAVDGDAAVEVIARIRPDVVTLDVQMPGRDGIEVLRALKQRGLSPRSIMVSSLTAQGAPTTVAALMEGAFDFILKPTGLDLHVTREIIQRELTEKLATVRLSMGPPAMAALPPSHARPTRPLNAALKAALKAAHFDAIVIGASTGGPQALRSVIPLLPADLPVPVFIVQHIPAQFTGSLAERLDGMSRLRVVEAADGMVVAPGRAFVAPGGSHLGLAQRGDQVVCLLDDGPRRRGCRPSVDHLLESATRLYNGRVMAAVLTGMGCDGLDGCRELKRRGGTVLAQSAAGCVVYGMPKAVSEAGLVDEVVPLEQMAARLSVWLRGTAGE
jgi:two-component system, chemotaxis family, protein-glutamate methylesterase/glutaminase